MDIYSDSKRKINEKIKNKDKILKNEYQLKKQMEILDLINKVYYYNERKEKLLKDFEENNKKLKELHTRKTIASLKIVSLLAIPTISSIIGNTIAKDIAKNTLEYQTITRTIDYNTGSVLGNPQIDFNEHEIAYKATVTKYSPWKNNDNGSGYIQDITVYEYNSANHNSAHNISNEELTKNIKEKYNYVNTKETLDKNDNTNDYTILITETYQNKNVNRNCTKFIIPFTVSGCLIGIIIDTLLVMISVYSNSTITEMFDGLFDEIKKCKLNNEQIEERLNILRNEAFMLKREYEKTVSKYGKIDEQITIEEIPMKLSLSKNKR